MSEGFGSTSNPASSSTGDPISSSTAPGSFSVGNGDSTSVTSTPSDSTSNISSSGTGFSSTPAPSSPAPSSESSNSFSESSQPASSVSAFSNTASSQSLEPHSSSDPSFSTSSSSSTTPVSSTQIHSPSSSSHSSSAFSPHSTAQSPASSSTSESHSSSTQTSSTHTSSSKPSTTPANNNAGPPSSSHHSSSSPQPSPESSSLPNPATSSTTVVVSPSPHGLANTLTASGPDPSFVYSTNSPSSSGSSLPFTTAVSDTSSSFNRTAVIGGSLAGFFLVAVLILVGFLVYHRRNTRRARPDGSGDDRFLLDWGNNGNSPARQPNYTEGAIKQAPSALDLVPVTSQDEWRSLDYSEKSQQSPKGMFSNLRRKMSFPSNNPSPPNSSTSLRVPNSGRSLLPSFHIRVRGHEDADAEIQTPKAQKTTSAEWWNPRTSDPFAAPPLQAPAPVADRNGGNHLEIDYLQRRASDSSASLYSATSGGESLFTAPMAVSTDERAYGSFNHAL